MKRVFWLTVLLISTYVFELLFLYPGNIVDEVSYYKPTSQISVTNTTIYNKDIDHYYKIVKQLKEADFESLDNQQYFHLLALHVTMHSIFSNSQRFVRNLSGNRHGFFW